MKNNDKTNKTKVNKDVINSEAKDLNNKDYIARLFASDDIKAPESLSENVIMAKIEALESESSSQAKAASGLDKDAASGGASGDKKWETASRRPRALRWVALAACAVLAVVSIPKLYYSDLFMPDTSAKGGELHTFKSKGEIEHIIKSLNRTPFTDRFRFGYGSGQMEDIATENSDMEMSAEPSMKSSEGAKSMEAGTTTGTAGADHSETYLQVEDVDEADIVKVDGNYIYAVNNKREVVIYEAKDGKTKRLSTIGNNGVEQYIQDIFLKEDTLVAIGSVYDEEDMGYIAIVSYDITDRSAPKVINEFRQSGANVVSSRMVGDYVYLVTNTYAYDGWIVPKCTIDGEYKEMSPTDISCVPNPQNASYIILSAVDISSGKAGRSKTKAVMGASSDIYCNNHNLYVSVNEWDDKTDAPSTRIIRASLDGLNIKFNGTTAVRGYINNQFSMDEHDGYFRIATTSERGGIDVNNLYVLDDKLNEVGKIAGFARDESIKAVRFMGDKAYVITYEAIDPLFIMDLSDPANPRIDGEVKIDGFSSLLVPIDGTRLLGIGHATGDNGYGGEYASGLKLALFDISDPSEPKVLDSKEFENMESPAQGTHLALTVNKKAGYYALPYNIWDYGTQDLIVEDAESTEDGEEASAIPEPESETGVLVFGVGEENKDIIEVYEQHKLDAVQILRSPYIGDYIYGIDGSAEVQSFKFSK